MTTSATPDTAGTREQTLRIADGQPIASLFLFGPNSDTPTTDADLAREVVEFRTALNVAAVLGVAVHCVTNRRAMVSLVAGELEPVTMRHRLAVDLAEAFLRRFDPDARPAFGDELAKAADAYVSEIL